MILITLHHLPQSVAIIDARARARALGAASYVGISASALGIGTGVLGRIVVQPIKMRDGSVVLRHYRVDDR